MASTDQTARLAGCEDADIVASCDIVIGAMVFAKNPGVSRSTSRRAGRALKDCGGR
jgi:hypothetical protein